MEPVGMNATTQIQPRVQARVIDKGQVVLAMADGSKRKFEPDRLPCNLLHGAVTIARIAERTTLVVDDVKSLERDIVRREGEKTSAIEAVKPALTDHQKLPQREPGRDLNVDTAREK